MVLICSPSTPKACVSSLSRRPLPYQPLRGRATCQQLLPNLESGHAGLHFLWDRGPMAAAVPGASLSALGGRQKLFFKAAAQSAYLPEPFFLTAHFLSTSVFILIPQIRCLKILPNGQSLVGRAVRHRAARARSRGIIPPRAMLKTDQTTKMRTGTCNLKCCEVNHRRHRRHRLFSSPTPGDNFRRRKRAALRAPMAGSRRVTGTLLCENFTPQSCTRNFSKNI